MSCIFSLNERLNEIVSHALVIFDLRQNGGQSVWEDCSEVQLSILLSLSLSLLPSSVRSSPSAVGSLIKQPTKDTVRHGCCYTFLDQYDIAQSFYCFKVFIVFCFCTQISQTIILLLCGHDDTLTMLKYLRNSACFKYLTHAVLAH